MYRNLNIKQYRMQELHEQSIQISEHAFILSINNKLLLNINLTNASSSSPTMATSTDTAFFIIFTIFFSLHAHIALICSFTISNNCPQPIWPATLAGAGTPQLSTTGLKLDQGQSIQIPTPQGWSGRIWARTGCKFNEAGIGECETGDCGGKMECNGLGASPPATLFEITFGRGNGDDFYDVSVVDGYNLPMVATPRIVDTVNNSCYATGCVADLNTGCPRELQVEGNEGTGIGVVACKSACEAFRLDQYCCSGKFSSPTTCRPSFYSSLFKSACPRAYSYAYDDGTSTFTCKALDYVITFCPTINGLRRSNGLLTSQSETGQGTKENPEEMNSSANALILSFYTLITFILFF